MTAGDISFTREEIEGSIPVRFEKVAAFLPDQPAVVCAGRIQTFQDLNKRANRVARLLQKEKLVSSTTIAVLPDDPAETPAILLGILKAGMVYVVLDASLPQKRLSAILDDAQAGCLLAAARHKSLADKLGCPLVLPVEADLQREGETGNIGLEISPGDPAAIYYTSGSSGDPKGVLRNHRDILYRGWNHCVYYGVGTNDRVSQVFSFSFAASTSDVFGALLNGATLCLHDLRNSSLKQTAAWLKDEKVTIFHPPVAYFRQLVEHLDGENQFPDLRMVQLGGAPLYKEDVQRARKVLPPTCVLNNRYATTEAGLIASHLIGPETVISRDIVPVGYPVEGMEVLLLNEGGRQVSNGEAGEIAVRSRYLTPGYWRDAVRTGEKFLQSASTGEPPLYLTGDMGRFDPDGCLEHLGRKDRVAKIRGYRVDTGEVETALHEQAAIQDAVVVSRPVPHAPEENRLVAYLVLKGGAHLHVHELRDFLRQKLPAYMLPARFVFLDVMPLNQHGKPELPALPEPSAGGGAKYLPARSKTEKILLHIWRQEFKFERISVRDDFFELGGDSLLAALLHSHIEQHFARRLPLTFITDNPTIEKMAAGLKRGLEVRQRTSLVPIQPDGSRPSLFIFPGNSGRILYYYHRLAALLGADQPVYGVEMLKKGVQTTPSTWLPESAARYLKEVREFQPFGPYYLAGYSFGGLLTFEIARQLKAAGEQVAFLGLFNSHLPSGYVERIHASTNQPENRKGSTQAGAAWKERGKRLRTGMRDTFDRFEQSRFMRGLLHLAGLEPADVADVNAIAARTYQPGFYEGVVHLFRALDDTGSKYDERLAAWRETIRELVVHDIPGTHGTIMDDDHLPMLARELKESLELAQIGPFPTG